MTASTTTGPSIPEQVTAESGFAAGQSGLPGPHPRRHIDPASGHALEILGHAIEYLADELVHNSELILANDPRVEAVQLLMDLNRQVYFACPEERTLRDRCRSLLHMRST